MSNLHLGGGYFTDKNVKAFTLIELLAVIVILAIIALIATPIILGIIGETKEKAFKLSLKNAEHAYEIYEVQHNIKPGTEVNIKDLPLDSNLSGTISTNKEGKVNFKDVTDGTYSASGPVDDINMIKGTPEDLLKNILTVKVNTNFSSRNIVITVETIEGIPTSYSYKIEGPDNYKKEVNNVTSNTNTFNKLKPNTEYSIIVTVKNKAGLTKEITKTGKTLSIDNITLDLTPKDEYIKEGKVTINYPSVEDAVNKYKWSDEEEFTPVIENSVEVPAKNGTLIAIVSDGEEVVTQNSITINNIDTTGPEFTTSISEGKVTITASDPVGLHTKAYSCDGVWQSSNVCIFTSSGNHTVNVRDALENEGEETTVIIAIVNTPILGSLTPVVYKNNNWVVANTSIKWYDYTNQEWANAVLLKSGVTKNVGDTVTVEGSNPDVMAMFVWIPRYEYKIEGEYGKGGTSATSPGEIEVKFISKSKTTADTGYRIHPAFNFGGTELDGIWVGKFETTGTASTPTILPNVTSLRSQTVSLQSTTAKKFTITGYDSHMSKNSEWGAAAYLSQSKYGKYGNPSYSGAEKEVAINSNSSYMTGGGNYTSNIAQSTTGNITGIYDMSGGAYEHVMGVYSKTVGSSGFSSLPDAKYYDNYTTSDKTTACSGGICYGHAFSETAGWYRDSTNFVYSSSPWMKRGGYYDSGAGAGVFASNSGIGNSGSGYSFRVVLAQTT